MQEDVQKQLGDSIDLVQEVYETVVNFLVGYSFQVLGAEGGEEIVIPNKHIVGEIHRNSFANRIIEGQVGIAYGSDPEQTIAVIRKAIAEVDGIAEEPVPQIGIAIPLPQREVRILQNPG